MADLSVTHACDQGGSDHDEELTQEEKINIMYDYHSKKLSEQKVNFHEKLVKQQEQQQEEEHQRMLAEMQENQQKAAEREIVHFENQDDEQG